MYVCTLMCSAKEGQISLELWLQVLLSCMTGVRGTEL